MSAQVLSVMREAARGLEFMFTQISAGINQWMRNNRGHCESWLLSSEYLPPTA